MTVCGYMYGPFWVQEWSTSASCRQGATRGGTGVGDRRAERDTTLQATAPPMTRSA